MKKIFKTAIPVVALSVFLAHNCLLKLFGFWTRYFVFADQVPVLIVPINPEPKAVAPVHTEPEEFQRVHLAKPKDPDG